MFPMKKQTIFTVFALILILSMILGACAPATEAPPTSAPATSTPLPPPPTYTPAPQATEMPAATNTEAAMEPTEAMAPTETMEPTAEMQGEVNAWGVTLPADAAPLDQQYVRYMSVEGTTLDFAVSVYKRPAATDILTTPLVRLNKNFEILPAAALSWEVSPDGTTWTFHLDPALTWSDGNPYTADDIVSTFQYQADPKHAWDFTWFWSDIVNWDDAVAGKVPLSDIGVKKVDDHTVQFMTTVPSPYFLSKALYVRPLSKVAFDKYGEYYDNDPQTSVSSSPWILEEWTKGKQLVFGPNTHYTGKLKPYLEKLIVVFAQDMSNEFSAYQNNEVDIASNFTPADIELISNDPELNAEYHPSFGDFRTYYLGFDEFDPPFNDLKVREAIAKVIDRDAIIQNVVKRQGIPAYSFLMPGFPDASADVLKNEDINKLDIPAAKQLLADAGYPDGQGFPALQLTLRNENALNQSVASAIASMITDNLGIQVEVKNEADAKVFMDALNAHTLQFYMVSYGFDYLDASNMLGIWVTGGRHAWSNPEFDQLVKDASSSVDMTKRSEEFKAAEKILVDDAGGIFIYHATPGNIYRPYLKGEELEPDKTGVAAAHWPTWEDIGMLMPTVYISKDVANYRK
jgi:ABC-type transport system substrate-binding protein